MLGVLDAGQLRYDDPMTFATAPAAEGDKTEVPVCTACTACTAARRQARLCSVDLHKLADAAEAERIDAVLSCIGAPTT